LSCPTEAPSWLKEKVYGPKVQRTTEIVRKAVDALVAANQRVSYASVIAKSKDVDPEGKGVSETGIRGNTEAKAYFDQHCSWKGPRNRHAVKDKPQSTPAVTRSIDPNRDSSRVRQRLMRLEKVDLVERVLALEQNAGAREQQWLELNDDLLHWRLRAEKAEAQVEKSRQTPKVEDERPRFFQGSTENSMGSVEDRSNAELRTTLEAALKRAGNAEKTVQELRVQLFARRVVRMRDKARRLSK
jgi:hypothetical protein